MDEAARQQTLELNPSHPLIVNLNQLRKGGDRKNCSLVARQLLDNVLTQTGIPYNFQDSVSRQYSLLSNYVELLVEGKDKGS
jgi:HSP90 family molecular chaperone